MPDPNSAWPVFPGIDAEGMGDDTLRVLWAAMCAMTQDVHAPQDHLTDEQWQAAHEIYDKLNAEADKRFAESPSP